MAKGRYEKWRSEDNLLKLEAWARDGLTDEQIAHNIGISRQTLYDWKNKYPDISDALKKGKEVVDIIVENALFKKATGFRETIKKPIKVKKITYKDGKKKSEKEIIEYADEEVFVAPDVTAQIFWLKNRKPEIWRDKQEVEMENDISIAFDDFEELIK